MINFKFDLLKEILDQPKIKQYDTRVVKAELYENNITFDLAGYNVIIQASNSAGQAIIQTENITIENNTITCELDKNMTTVPGYLELEYVITKDTKQLTTFTAKLEVKRSVIDGLNTNPDITLDLLEVLTGKIIEAQTVKSETEQLIATGGAATKGEVQNLSASLDTMLHYKANYEEVIIKGQGTLSDFDEETRRAIQGLNSSEINAVLGDGNVTRLNLDNDLKNEIGKMELYFTSERISLNLFNKFDVKTKGFYDRVTGEWTINNSYYNTNNITCHPNQKIYFSHPCSAITCWDYNNNFITGLTLVDKNVQIPNHNNIMYFRVQIPINIDKNNLMISQMEDFIYEPFTTPEIELNKNVRISKLDTSIIEGVEIKTPPSKNLFDKNTIIDNGFYDRVTGEWTINNNFFSSNLIRVKKDDLLISNFELVSVSLFNDNGVFIKGESIYNESYRIQDDIAFVVFQINKTADKNSLMISLNELPLSYQSYSKPKYKLKNDVWEVDIAPLNIDGVMKIKEKTSNLFNKLDVAKNGYFSWDTGVWNETNLYCSSNYIEVTPNSIYAKSSNGGVCFYNSSKQYIGGIFSQSFLTPSNTAYVRFSVLTVELDQYMFALNSLPMLYEPYNPLDKYGFDDSIWEVAPHTDSKNLNASLGKVKLFIETDFNGGNQPIHPKVVSLTTPIGGYKYYMAYTPYPFSIDIAENPSIACSNDLIKWETPVGLINPIDDSIESSQKYLSDTHLLFNPNTKLLECWYRGVITSPEKTVTIFRKTSSDGINWSTREVCYQTQDYQDRFVSPCVIYENGKYRMWIASDGRGLYESPDGLNWTYISNYTCDNDVFPIWHMDIEKTDIGYEMVVCESSRTDSIVHYISNDGINWTDKKVIIQTDKSQPFGYQYLYRACLLKDKNRYYIYTSGADEEGNQGITLSISQSDNIESLLGITSDYNNRMSKPTRKPKYAFKDELIYDETDGIVYLCVKGGLNTEYVQLN